MSLGYPTLRPQPEGSTVLTDKSEGYGVPNRMIDGFTSVKTSPSSHPLEFSEKNWRQHQDKMDLAMLRNMQGIHAPLRLQMERKTVGQIQRLPCLASSNVLSDSLTGRLDTIEFEDFLGNVDDAEMMGQPHMMAERQLKLL